MMEKDIFSFSVTELAENIKSRKLTSEQVVTAYYNRILQVNPKINGITQLNEQAIFQAKQADHRLSEVISRGEEVKGLLYGVPFTIKDHIGVKGFKFTLSCKKWKDEVAPQNATIVQRLFDEGGILLGITNMPEMGFSVDTDSYLYGKCRNPYDLERSSGGSSGGEGVIIGSRGSPLGIGSDIGGSIRIPSHFNGIVGLKPSEGLLPVSGLGPLSYLGYGVMRLFLSLGPMARHVEDLELALRITSGDDEIDSRSTGKYVGDSNSIDIKKLKVVVFKRGPKPAKLPTEETIQAINETANRLRNAGVVVEEVEVPDLLDNVHMIWAKVLSPSISLKAQCEHPCVNMCFDLIDPQNLNMITMFDYFQASVDLDTFRSKMLEFMRKGQYDAILAPCTHSIANLIGQQEIDDVMYTIPYNLTGWPVVVISSGLGSVSKMPIGLQVIGKVKRDDIALALAKVAHLPCPQPNL